MATTRYASPWRHEYRRRPLPAPTRSTLEITISPPPYLWATCKAQPSFRISLIAALHPTVDPYPRRTPQTRQQKSPLVAAYPANLSVVGQLGRANALIQGASTTYCSRESILEPHVESRLLLTDHIAVAVISRLKPLQRGHVLIPQCVPCDGNNILAWNDVVHASEIGWRAYV